MPLLIKAWLELYGWDFVQKLKANVPIETRLQTETIQAVARGEDELLAQRGEILDRWHKTMD